MQRSLEERERVSKECYEMARGLKQDSSAQVQNALRLLNESLDAKPTYLNALLLRAALLGKTGEYNAAIADLTLAAQLEELSVDRRRLASSYASRAALYFRLRKTQEGIMDLTRAAEIEPDNGTWQCELGQAYLREGNVALAKLAFQSALQDKLAGRMSDMTKFRALLCLGACRLHDGDLRLAAATLERAQALHESAALHHLMGLTRYREAAYGAAADHFHRALEMNEKSLVYRLNLGVCTFTLKDYAAAEQLLSAALAQHPKVPQLLFTHACVQLKLGMLPQALAEIDEAIQLDPQPAAYYYAKGLIHMAEATSASYAEAASAFASTLQAQPSFHEAHLQLGLLAHCHPDDLFTALSHLHAALDATRALSSTTAASSVHDAGGEVTVLERLALVYGDLGYHDTAVRVLRRCVALCPGQEMPRYRLAVAQVASGDYYGAWQTLQRPEDEGKKEDSEEERLTTLEGHRGGEAATVTSLDHTAPPRQGTVAEEDDSQANADGTNARRGATGALSSAAALHTRAVALKELHRYDEALDSADAALALSRSVFVPAFYLNRAEICFCMADYAACVEDTDKLVQRLLKPTQDKPVDETHGEKAAVVVIAGLPETYYLQGRAYYALGRNQDALVSLDKAAEALPALQKHHAFCYARGVFLAREARWAEALQSLDLAVRDACARNASNNEEDKEDGSKRHPPRCDRCVYYHERAKVRQVRGDAAGAVADFDVVLTRQPNNFNALLRRAFALKALQRFDEASRDLQRATRHDTTGALASLTSQDFYTLPFIELAAPGEEADDDDKEGEEEKDVTSNP